jgi:hypothetical protein
MITLHSYTLSRHNDINPLTIYQWCIDKFGDPKSVDYSWQWNGYSTFYFIHERDLFEFVMKWT